MLEIQEARIFAARLGALLFSFPEAKRWRFVGPLFSLQKFLEETFQAEKKAEKFQK